MPGDPCVLCGHAPHANSSPSNPAGCNALTNEFKHTACGCPEYRAPSAPPQSAKRHLTHEIWPTCGYGEHYVDSIEEVDHPELPGATILTARCCGHEETLVVPNGARLQRTIFGLQVVQGATTKNAAPMARPTFPVAKGAAPSEPMKPGDEGRFNLLEID